MTGQRPGTGHRGSHVAQSEPWLILGLLTHQASKRTTCGGAKSIRAGTKCCRVHCTCAESSRRLAGDGLHPLLPLFCSGVRGLQGAEFLLAGAEFSLVSVDFTLNLLGNSLSHLLFSHFLEGIHLLGKTLQPVANFCSLEAELGLNFSTNLCFTLANIDQCLVAHDLFTLVQLALELRGDFVLLAVLEGLKSLFHLDLQLEGGFLLEQVEIRFVRQALVAKLCVNLGHDGLPCCGLSGLEFEIEPFGPVLLVGGVLRLKLLAQFGFTLVAITGQSILNLGLSSMTIGGELVFFSMFKFSLNFGLEAS